MSTPRPRRRQTPSDHERLPSRFGKSVAAFAAFMLAAIGLQVAFAPAASAAEITDAVTNVTIEQDSIPNSGSSMRLNVDFALDKGAAYDGDVREGDTFWVELDPKLKAANGTFDIYNNAQTEVVAVVTVEDNLATFTLTSYAQERLSTTGQAHWDVLLQNNTLPAGDQSLVFVTANHQYDEVIHINAGPNDGGGPVYASKSGDWENPLEPSVGLWRMNLPSEADHDRVVFEDHGYTKGPLWEFDCARVTFDMTTGTTVSFECESDYLRWEVIDIEEGGTVAMTAWFNVLDPSTSGDLLFTNIGQFNVDDETPEVKTATVQQSTGGLADGPTAPSSPTVTQAICADGTLQGPTVELAQNGRGIFYTMNPEVPQNGDEVTVTAELVDNKYSWADSSEFPQGWRTTSATRAVFETTLDDVPCAAIIPNNPEVVQATCIAGTGTFTEPTVTTTDSDWIHYEVIGDVTPGNTVTVIGTLQDTVATGWSEDLPDGWSINPDGNAERRVTLDTPPCATAISPVNPEVIQATCIAGTGTLTDPTVTATDTDLIHYEITDDVTAGTTVTVVGTLQDTDANVWDESNLPDGWSINTDGNAERSVVLDAPPCATAITPVNPEVIQATCIAGTGTLTDPTITATDTDLISYEIKGDITPGSTVTVIATLEDDEAYDWGDDLTDGWRINTDGNAERSVVLDSPPCATAIAPVNPEVAQATCIAGTGNLTEPTITATDTDFVHYEVNDATSPGGTATVIATLQDIDANEWSTDLPDGWSINSDGDAELSIVLDAPPCATAVTPIDPEVTQATCIAGAGNVTEPTITATDTDLIHYEINDDITPGTTVTVIATLQNTAANEWSDELPDGWSINTDGNAERTITLDSPPCATAVTPVNPEVTQAICDGITPSQPKITAAEDGDGITYRIIGTVKAGEEVQVVATLADTVDYEWNDTLPDGWSINTDGEATFSVDLDARDCETGLAITGMDGSVIWFSVAGGTLLFGGLILMLIRARRRDEVNTES